MKEITSYKQQETALILLNIGVLAALFSVHISFLSLLGQPSRLLLATLAIRFVILIFELLWIQRLTEESRPSSVRVHIYLSIILNITCAFAATRFGTTADSHYSVLMIIPIISAAYRFDLIRTLVVTGITIGLTFLEVWLYFRAHPPAEIGEYFEAAIVSLIFLVVAIVVWLLVGNLRTEEEKLGQSLDDLHLLQAKLVNEEKLAAIGQLSSAIAHEIRNPVTMIASSLKMAENYEPGSPVRLEMFNIATEEAKRLETLTTDFLAFARTKEPERKPVAVAETLGYIASLAKARMSEKGLALVVKCEDSLVLEIDETQIQQALLNLLTNAINATPATGVIAIGAHANNGESVLFVENDGRAIPAEIAGRIFEPFFTHGEKGTGLGLSIVRNIARAHGGNIFLACNEHGRVRFEIRF
jgi:signal transduction histidine kinase